MFLAYIAGLLTLPAFYVLYVTWAWASDRNLRIDCMDCNRRFGILSSEAEECGINPTLTLVTRFKFKWHRWTGQCQEVAGN